MKITDYHFGSLSTDHETFDKDVIIGGNNIFSNWWRQEGHKLHWRDIADYISRIEPEIVVVGQGKFRQMTVLPEVEEELRQRNIRLIAFPTSKAVQEFNRLEEEYRVLGAFHLTC